tara:strand:+ start:256 stop:963 length:708 start_codon:yes stop_codon:yes gene_type:complete
MAFTNSINLNSNGIPGYNTSTGAFTATALTQYYVLSGGASAQSINQIAPSATVGVPLVCQGVSAHPIYTEALVVGGGTGRSSLTAFELLAGGTTSTGNVQQISIGSAGQVLVSGGAGVLPSFQAFSPSSQAPYLNTTGTTQTMVVNELYVANNAGLVTFTPPAACAVGTVFGVAGNGAGGWTIDLVANSQTFNFGNTAGTTAVASSNRYDAVEFVCTVANTTFSLVNSVGNLSVT